MEVDTKAELVGKGTFDDYLSSKESRAWVRLCGSAHVAMAWIQPEKVS